MHDGSPPRWNLRAKASWRGAKCEAPINFFCAVAAALRQETTKKAQSHRPTLLWAMSDCAFRRRFYSSVTGKSGRARAIVYGIPEPDHDNDCMSVSIPRAMFNMAICDLSHTARAMQWHLNVQARRYAGRWSEHAKNDRPETQRQQDRPRRI